MTPLCPHCQRPIQSRAAKHCIFCGKAFVEGEPDWAKASEQKREEAIRQNQEAAQVSINPMSPLMAGIVERGGTLEEVDAIYGDKFSAAEAYGEAMTARYSMARATLAKNCDCDAGVLTSLLVSCTWKTSDQVRRRADWNTVFMAFFFGRASWKVQRSWCDFSTLHAKCERCGLRVLKAWAKRTRLKLAGIGLGIAAAGVLLHAVVMKKHEEFVVAGVLGLGCGIAWWLSFSGKLDLGRGISTSARCRIASLTVSQKE